MALGSLSDYRLVQLEVELNQFVWPDSETTKFSTQAGRGTAIARASATTSFEAAWC